MKRRKYKPYKTSEERAGEIIVTLLLAGSLVACYFIFTALY